MMMMMRVGLLYTTPYNLITLPSFKPNQQPFGKVRCVNCSFWGEVYSLGIATVSRSVCLSVGLTCQSAMWTFCFNSLQQSISECKSFFLGLFIGIKSPF